jgi:transporter family-2 protein
MKNILYLFLALCAGGLLPIQGSINAHLGKSLNHPLQATFISFFGAIIVLFLLLLAFNPSWPSVSQLKATPVFYFTGGIYGVIFVTSILMLAPKSASPTRWWPPLSASSLSRWPWTTSVLSACCGTR